MRRALLILALALLAASAKAQLVHPDARRLLDVACVLSGCETGIPGSGTVTSVGNGTIGPLFGASWATATSTPALTLNLAAQAANCVIAGPTSGGNAVPTCRSLVSADLGSFALNGSFNTVTAQPATDVAAGTFRRSAALATANIVEFQDQTNAVLSGITAAGAFTGNIVSNSWSVSNVAEDVLLSAGTKVVSGIPFQVSGDSYFQLEEQELDASGAVVGSYVTCETTAGAVVATMTAGGAGDAGRFATIRRSGANTCTVGVGSGQTLDGVTDGTTTIANGAWKTFVQTGAAAWATTDAYPVVDTTGNAATATALAANPAACSVGQYVSDIAADGTLTCGTPAGGGLSGLTTGAVQYADSATTIAATPLIRESADIMSQRNGTTAQEFQLYATYSGAGANYERLTTETLSTTVWRWMTEKAGTGATRSYRWGIDGTDYLFLTASSLTVNGSFLPQTTDAVNLGGTSNIWMNLYNSRSVQGSKSKALVDATATNLWQVAVASNSYEGLSLDYTIFATDGTDRQTLQGTIKVAINNNGGTETCVFSTPSEAVNPSTGTLAVTWDCTAGTDTVMIRATADTSLASTTTFTAESRINLTSGTATLTPQ